MDILSALLEKLWPSARTAAPAPVLGGNSDLQGLPRCATGCAFGHCTLQAEPWFTRVLSLERKRSERSRKPFILALLDLEGARELNGERDRLVHDVVTALSSFIRATDMVGWYRGDAILGVLFTELGKSANLHASVDSISTKVITAIGHRVGREKSRLIHMSCHVFPEDWSSQKPGGRVDTVLYPEERRRSTWLQSAGKRMIDVSGSVAALLLLSPLLLVIAVLVKLSSKGPVLFRQIRIGQFGRSFTFLKFRSMQVSNDATIHQEYVKKLIAGGKGVGQNGVYKIQNDPRITRIGQFLRKTSLDELPQFWNVLKGDMSLVGPRPPLPYEADAYDIWHRRRLLHAKPGITGLWQVTGRSRTTFDEMVRLDLRYIESSSLWLDIKILLNTPAVVMAGSGAY